MGQIATRIEEQINLLRERGMILDVSEDKIKEVLLDIGYYRLGFYWHPFEIDSDHNFRADTKFSTILSLYYFDVDVRSILTKSLSRIELNFRTKLIYYASNKFKHSPIWFVDAKVMEKEFVNSFNDFYNAEFKTKNKQIKNHHAKHINDKYAPAWKTLEFFTFGQILKIFKSIRDADIKERIAQIYGVKNLDKFINFFETLVFIRNCCAHGGVLYDLNLPRSISAFPGIKFSGSERHNLDACIKVILFVLEKISANRSAEMAESLQGILDNNSANSDVVNIIEDKTGIKFA